MTLPSFRNEPLTAFANPDSRGAQLAALAALTARLGESYPLIIGEATVLTDQSIDSYSPSDPGLLVGRVASARVEEAVRALETAHHAFDRWRRTPGEVRARVLLRAAAILRRRKFEFNAWLMHEAGKPWVEADADVAEAIDFMEYYARQMIRLKGPQPLTTGDGEENHLHYLPLGVGVVHSPFNFPLAIMVGMTAAAIVTGNTVVVKPSQQTPVVAAKFFDVLADAGLPPGVANYLPGDPAVIGEVLTTHPLVRFINFTGSAAVGASLHAAAAQVRPGQPFLRRFVAEMGGKDAIIVADDADLDLAAQEIVASAFGYSGQKCSACSRVVADARVHDQLLDRVINLTRLLQLGSAVAPETEVGPLISAAAQDRILHYVGLGRQEGELVLGGEAVAGSAGYLVHPTIFADVRANARIAQEEIFGPVVSFIRARDYQDALTIANGTVYGLTGAVFTRSRARLEQARADFHVGNLYLNRKCTGAYVGRHPFGGFNLSGTDSKAGGPDYLQLFLQAKSVAERL